MKEFSYVFFYFFGLHLLLLFLGIWTPIWYTVYHFGTFSSVSNPCFWLITEAYKVWVICRGVTCKEKPSENDL